MPIPSPSNTANRSARAILATNVVRLRGEKKWSQEMLGFESGLHRTFIAHVERQVRNISIDNLEKIANALGVAPHQLLTPQ
ncbi:helix-turn-helix transcriptional regulator [Janthinobacterium sp. SUN176]|uniref:helix-turn-helix domain-containing protein n=1 Tax=Janthinobacterium sp. SUN176 TaxID=3014788 RepID=UPI002713AD2D|nr:helix-turn-helix transcriptional regulator [Janthinobacterium sp. SUN176]MDO8074761.1 helix-turn-helix transcriptional regulator [Janthinobacterium sp. SUN176]